MHRSLIGFYRYKKREKPDRAGGKRTAICPETDAIMMICQSNQEYYILQSLAGGYTMKRKRMKQNTKMKLASILWADCDTEDMILVV